LIKEGIDMSLPIGLQLYSIKDETAKDFVGSLRKVAEIGYDGVEFAGYGGLSSAELKALLDELGLKACGSHVQFKDIENNIDDVIEYNLAIGNEYIICPYTPFNDLENVKHVTAVLKAAGEKCKAKGLKIGYHNHANEFVKFDGEYGLDILFKEVPKDVLIAEIDTFWVEYAGLDNVEYINKHAGRCELIHIKDMMELPDGKKESTEVGTGTMKFPPIIEAAKKQGAKWLVVEQEYFTRPSLEAVKICYDNLKKMA
jgi:sugar phosphate isomerase/epimerase